MSDTANEMNKVTGAIIGISGRLIVYALLVFLLFEGVTKGYAFGHEIFYATAVEASPGTDRTVEINKETSVSQTADILLKQGLIKNKTAFIIQCKFYEYKISPGTYELNTSMTSKEMLQLLNEEPKEESGDS